jgi:hypothetical protein
LAGGILWPTASQPWDADGTRDSSAPVGAASGGPQAKNMARVPRTRCRPLRGSAPLLLRPFPRLARRGPHDVATAVAQTSPSALILAPIGDGGEGGLADPSRPAGPLATLFRPGTSGLNYSANF